MVKHLSVRFLLSSPPLLVPFLFVSLCGSLGKYVAGVKRGLFGGFHFKTHAWALVVLGKRKRCVHGCACGPKREKSRKKNQP